MKGLGGLFRYFAYAGAVALIGWVVMLIAGQGGGVPELLAGLVPPPPRAVSPVLLTAQWMRILLIAVSGLVFAWVALHDRLRRPMAVGIGTLFLLFFIRELHFLIDRYLVANLGQVMCACAAAFAGVYDYRHRMRLLIGWLRSWPSAGLALIIAGLLLLVPFGVPVSAETLWSAVVNGDDVQPVRSAFSGLLQLGAWILIAVGSLEFLYGWLRLPVGRTVISRYKRRR